MFIPVVIIISAFTLIVSILLYPHNIKLKFLKELPYDDSDMPFPIWWAQITEYDDDDIFGRNFLEEMKIHNFEDKYIIISWGRPIKSLTYKYFNYIVYGNDYGIRPDPVFGGGALAEDKIYIYEMQKKKKIDDRYFSRFNEPDIIIEVNEINGTTFVPDKIIR